VRKGGREGGFVCGGVRERDVQNLSLSLSLSHQLSLFSRTHTNSLSLSLLSLALSIALSFSLSLWKILFRNGELVLLFILGSNLGGVGPVARTTLRFISLVLGPLNSLVWYVPFLRYTRGLGWRIHCGVEVTESSTNKQHHHESSTNKRHHLSVPLCSRPHWRTPRDGSGTCPGP
jgi:hypothetical protein